MDAEGPFTLFTFIFCRSDERADRKIAAFPNVADATEHARLRLLRMPAEWLSVVVGEGVDAELEFVGCWNRDDEGALRWEAASLA